MTQWDKPDDFDGKSVIPVNAGGEENDDEEDEMMEWIQIWSPADEAFYFFNNFTSETTWE